MIKPIPTPILLGLGSILIAVWLSGCAALVVGGAVGTGAAVAHDRRTTGTVVEDQSIETKARRAISGDTNLRRQSHINITSYNMNVLLSGETPSEAMRARAGELVRNVGKVRNVYNELTVAAPSSHMVRSSDTWITTKVKANLFGVKVKGFDPTRVKVITENGTVFLLGLVSRPEGDAAAESARQITGVQRVVKLFEYRG